MRLAGLLGKAEAQRQAWKSSGISSGSLKNQQKTP